MKKFEGSAKDMAQDKKLAKKRGVSLKAWENSSADDKHDRQQSMAGLKRGGTMKKFGDGGLGRTRHDEDSPMVAPAGRPQVDDGASGLAAFRERMGIPTALGAPPTAMPAPRMAAPMAPPPMPGPRPAAPVMRPSAGAGFKKGGSVDGVAKKGKTSTKVVKMAKGGSFRASANGIASKGKTRGKMC